MTSLFYDFERFFGGYDRTYSNDAAYSVNENKGDFTISLDMPGVKRKMLK